MRCNYGKDGLRANEADAAAGGGYPVAFFIASESDTDDDDDDDDDDDLEHLLAKLLQHQWTHNGKIPY